MRMFIYLEIKVQALQKPGTGKARLSRRACCLEGSAQEVWFFMLARGSAAGAFFRRSKPQISVPTVTSQGHFNDLGDFHVSCGRSLKAGG